MALSRWKQIHNTPDNATGHGSSAAGAKPSAAIILGLGTDLCAIARLQRELAREQSGILSAVFRPDEHRRCRSHRHPERAYAACFAAKEAVIKALAEARGQGMFWQDIEISDPGDGPAAVALHGRLADLARGLGVEGIHVSWAHCRDYATASAIVTGSAATARPDPMPDAGAPGPTDGGQ